MTLLKISPILYLREANYNSNRHLSKNELLVTNRN